jgi:hypothetical protein
MSRTRDISNIYNSDDFAGENVVSKNSDYTAEDNETVFVTTASAAVTITLPPAPTLGSRVKIIDYGNNASINNITINGNGTNINSSSASYVLTTNKANLEIYYIDPSIGWNLIDSTVPQKPDAPTGVYAIDVGTSRAYNNGAATVSFTSGGGGVATSFTVTSSPGNISASGGFSPITVAGLDSNTSYTFAVKATNDEGDSAFSLSSSAILITTIPETPTISNAVAGYESATISFSAPASGGKTITSYTTTSSPSGITASGSSSPLNVTSLVGNTNYTFTLTATNANGTSQASVASSTITPTTATTQLEYLVIAGGGGGGGAANNGAGGGGAGGYRNSVVGETSGRNSTTEAKLNVSRNSSYTVTVGAGGAGAGGASAGGKGSNSVLSSITSQGGGGGAAQQGAVGQSGGSGGGGAAFEAGGAGTANQGFDGGGATGQGAGSGGGGAGGNGVTFGNGGAALSSSITGTSVARAGGGSSVGTTTGGGGGGRTPGTGNTGGGGGGGTGGSAGASGGSGVVIIRYPNTFVDLQTIGAGLSYSFSNTGGNKIYIFTSGTGSITI